MEHLLHSLLSKQLIFIYYLQPFSKYSLKCFCKDKNYDQVMWNDKVNIYIRMKVPQCSRPIIHRKWRKI